MGTVSAVMLVAGVWAGGCTKGSSASGGCGANAYNHPGPKFCVQVPEGFKPGTVEDRAKGKKVLKFEKDSLNFSISWEPDTLEAQKSFVNTPSDADNKITTGELAGGLFRDAVYKAQTEQLDFYVPASDGLLLHCYVNASPEEAGVLVQACKSMRRL
jgi:hypothetical protein